MKLKILLLLGAFAFVAEANPIAVFDLNTFPMTMENVTIILHDGYATVDGTYMFKLPDDLDTFVTIKIPIVARISDDIEDIRGKAHIKFTGAAVATGKRAGIRELETYETYLNSDLPKGYRLVMAVTQVGITTHTFLLSIKYDQQLFGGIVYYLPIIKPPTDNPDSGIEPRGLDFQAKIMTEDGRDVSIEGPSQDAIWSPGSVMVFLKHRRLVAARTVDRPSGLDWEAPFYEIVSGARRCALHHVPLIIEEGHVDPRWHEIMFAGKLGPFAKSPNCFPWLDRYDPRSNPVLVKYEACPECEGLLKTAEEKAVAGEIQKAKQPAGSAPAAPTKQ